MGPLVLRENDFPQYENDIIANDDTFRENINFEDIDDIIVNVGAFRENINLENEDNIVINSDTFRGNINFENNDDIILNNDVFRRNNYFQNEDDIIPNDDAFRGYNYFLSQDEVNIIPDNDAFARNNENEDDRPPLSLVLFTPTLEYIRNVLYVALHQFFDEFEIAVVSCPCLTKPPYNFVANGLSGNTGILQMGDIHNVAPISQTDLIFDIRHILSSYCYDFFVMGSGFAAKPSMPYNGYLTINAIISANPTNIINNSRIVYEDTNTEQIRLQTVNDPNQIKCSMLGNFFFSEGKQGMMIKIRAKGRKTIYNLTTLIQYSLYFYCRYPIGLGVVLKIDGGKMLLYITPENYPESFTSNMDFDRWLRLYQFDCMDLVAIGALTNFLMTQIFDGYQTLANPYRFNILPNYETGGEFCFDMTPDETEYIGYFNIAQRIYF